MLFNCLDIDQRYESGKRSVELEELRPSCKQRKTEAFSSWLARPPYRSRLLDKCISFAILYCTCCLAGSYRPNQFVRFWFVFCILNWH